MARYWVEAMAASVEGYEAIIRRSDFRGEKEFRGDG